MLNIIFNLQSRIHFNLDAISYRFLHREKGNNRVLNHCIGNSVSLKHSCRSLITLSRTTINERNMLWEPYYSPANQRQDIACNIRFNFPIGYNVINITICLQFLVWSICFYIISIICQLHSLIFQWHSKTNKVI